MRAMAGGCASARARATPRTDAPAKRAGHGGMPSWARLQGHSGSYRASYTSGQGVPMMQPTEVLRTHIKAPDVLVIDGIFDGFSARLGDFSKRISLFRLLVPD